MMNREVEEALRLMQRNAPKIAQNQASVEELSYNQATRYDELGNDQYAIATKEGDAALAAQQESQRIAAGIGIQRGSSDDILYKLGQQFQAAEAARNQALAAIKEKKSVGFLDNPLQYIINQYSMNSDIEDYNQADEIGKHATAAMQNVNAAVQSSVQTQNAISDKLDIATNAAKARVVRSQADIAATDAAIKSVQYGTARLETEVNMSRDRAQLMYTDQSAAREAERLRLAQEQAARERKDRADKLATEKLSMEYTEDRINKGRLLRGMDPLDHRSAGMLRALIMTGRPIGKEFQTDFENGDKATPILASTPYEAHAIAVNAGINWTPDQYPVRDIFKEAERSVQATLNSGYYMAAGAEGKEPVRMPIDKRDKELPKALFDQEVARLVEADRRDATRASADRQNLYAIPSVGAIIAAAPAVANDPVIKSVIVPQLKAGVSLTVPDTIKQLNAAVGNGQVKFDDAMSSMAYLIHQGQSLNMATKDLTRFGVVPSDAGRSYNFPYKGQVYDISKEANLRRLSLRMAWDTERKNDFTLRESMLPGYGTPSQ